MLKEFTVKLLELRAREMTQWLRAHMRAGEMAQWVRAPDCSSEGLKFKSQQPHGGSQPSVTRSDALFWSV
jgi:very-short-patch-repair endonuclease